MKLLNPALVRSALGLILSVASLSAHAMESSHVERQTSPSNLVNNIYVDPGMTVIASLLSWQPILAPTVGMDFRVSERLTLGPAFTLSYRYDGSDSLVHESQLVLVPELRLRWFPISSADDGGFFVRLSSGLAMSREYRWSRTNSDHEGSSLGVAALETLALGYQWRTSGGFVFSADLGATMGIVASNANYMGENSRSQAVQIVPMVGLGIGFAP